jgi:membrane-bound lytic murein transglycosylase A
VPLTPQRSVAIDATQLPQGAPVFLSTTQPNSDIPLQRLVMAQDTGGAIRPGRVTSSASAPKRPKMRAA